MTQKITEKKYGARSRLTRTDEIGNLSRSLDIMAEQLGHFETQEKAFMADLAKQTLQLKQLNEYLVYFEESERKSIASKLHGTVAQTLAMGVSKIKTHINGCDIGRHDDLIQVKTFLEHSVKEIRTIIYELAPPILDDFDIDVAIEFLVEEINEKNGTGFDFTNRIGGPVPLNRAVKLTFYRAIKTIITNILEYADAPDDELELYGHEDFLCIRVQTRGLRLGLKQATTAPGDKAGHQNFSERMERLGGSILLKHFADRGSKITLKAPVLTQVGQENPE
ncbi:MAG: hypothetical protein HUN05_04380 [Desulfobacter sp.]|nr:MAG: hypothetical protein HUN05_04380 [Desulfobacter sp.]